MGPVVKDKQTAARAKHWNYRNNSNTVRFCFLVDHWKDLSCFYLIFHALDYKITLHKDFSDVKMEVFILNNFAASHVAGIILYSHFLPPCLII